MVHDEERTIEQELRDSLTRRTIQAVRHDERTGDVFIRCATADGDIAIFTFAASSFADAGDVWPPAHL
jgi:hypothetical protein